MSSEISYLQRVIQNYGLKSALIECEANAVIRGFDAQMDMKKAANVYIPTDPPRVR